MTEIFFIFLVTLHIKVPFIMLLWVSILLIVSSLLLIWLFTVGAVPPPVIRVFARVLRITLLRLRFTPCKVQDTKIIYSKIFQNISLIFKVKLKFIFFNPDLILPPGLGIERFSGLRWNLFSCLKTCVVYASFSPLWWLFLFLGRLTPAVC